MSYVQNNLLAGETVMRQARIHWFIFVPGAVVAALAVRMGMPHAAPGAGAFVLIVGLAMLADALAKTYCTELAITNRRVIAKHGFIARKTIELNLAKVESLTVDQGLFGRIFNYGLVTVNGTGGIRTPFKFIADPLAFRKAVNEEVETTQNPRPGGA